ncbi:hypothetical protein PanWU01x14_361830, partial [Parasponia andersonii]
IDPALTLPLRITPCRNPYCPHIRGADPDHTLPRHSCLATSSLRVMPPDAQMPRRSLVCVSGPTLCLAKSGTALHHFTPLNAQIQHDLMPRRYS